MGTLLWRMPGDSGAWKPIGKTRGSVRVPAEAVVRLDVSKAASNDLAWLDDLPPNDIQELNLHGTDVSDEALRHVTRLTGLRSIDLRSNRISDAGLEGFDALVNLEEIELDAIGVNSEGFGVGDGAMRWLGRLPKLRTINLRYAKVTDAGLADLVQCGSLTELVLAGTQVSDAGLPHLMKLPRLDTLFLGMDGDGANVTNEGLKTVGKLVNLSLLDLSGTKIAGEGLAHLKDLKKLKTLHLESTGVSEADLAYLEPFKSLEWLSLYDEGRITDVAAKNLARLKSLRHLDVHFNVTDKGVASLATLPHLEMLALNGDGITDASAECIANMESLKSLSFEACPITDDMLQAVAGLPNLGTLVVSQTRATGDGFGYLRHAAK
ncbi:MAG: leucine-rich repeat domain-containing protein, partial [Pirellulales bacterium]